MAADTVARRSRLSALAMLVATLLVLILLELLPVESGSGLLRVSGKLAQVFVAEQLVVAGGLVE